MQTTGWPPGMLQDDSRELSRWLSTRLGARYQLQRNNMQTNQTPEALAEECQRLANQLGATSLDRSTEAELRDAINRLRDMAASGAKECAALQRDAERWQWVRAENSRAPDGRWFAYPDPARLDEEIDAAIAATKRG